jgi:aryl-alcohol dehydrogenase-like predicted oxidoreductase
MLPRFTPEALEKNQALVDLLKRIGGEKQATPAQIALAWSLTQKPLIVLMPADLSFIAGMRTSERRMWN